MTPQVSVARFRGVLIAVVIAIAIGALLGLFAVADYTCDSAIPSFRGAIILVFLLVIAGPLVIGGLLVVAIGWWRRDAATIRSGVAMLLVGVALPGSFLVAETVANPCR